MSHHPEESALALAARLDGMLAAGPDYLVENVLEEIGELAGGLTDAGFRADLERHLDDASDRLDAARQWHQAAQALMEPVHELEVA